jgi:protein-arginine kinase activator protein McsA
MNEKGFAWFDKYKNNIPVLDSELNDAESIHPEYLQMLMRPLYGIAAAYLDSNPRLSEIVKKHKAIWAERAGKTAESKRNLDRIERLVQHIESL